MPVALLPGRAAELQLLLSRAAAGGDVVLEGPPGMGKTRLLAEVRNAAADRLLVLAGRCLPLSVDVPYLPVTDVVRTISDVDDGQLLKAVLEDCPAFVGPELHRVLPQVAASTSVPDGPAQTSRLFEAVRLLLARTADLRPVLIAIDDVQWCDSASVDLIDFLLAHARPYGIVLSVRDRFDVPLRVRHWLDRVRRGAGVQTLTLAGLRRDDIADQLHRLGHVVDAARLDLITERSGGNPFLVEQLVAASERTSLPTGVAALLAPRLDGLDAEAELLVRLLAVSRSPVPTEVASACGVQDVTRARRVLAGRMLLPLEPAGETLRLAHDLVAEAVSDSIDAGTRRDLHHRLAVAWGERPSPPAADVAEHLRLAGDDRNEWTWRRHALTDAERVGARAQALTHARRALQIAPGVGPDELADVVARGWAAARGAGDNAAAIELADRGESIASQCTDHTLVIQLLQNASATHAGRQPERAAALIAAAVDLGRRHPPTVEFAHALHWQLSLHRAVADFSAAEAVLTELVAVARLVTRPDVQVLAHTEQVWFAAVAGDLGVVVEAPHVGAGVLTGPLSSAIFATDALIITGRLEETIEIGRRALTTLCDDGLGDSSSASIVRGNIAVAQIQLGDIEAAAATIDPLSSGSPDEEHRATFATRAELDVVRGRLDDAARYWRNRPTTSSPVFVGAQLALAEQRLEELHWSGHSEAAVDLALALLDIVFAGDQSQFVGVVTWQTMRALAEVAVSSRARHDPATELDALHHVDQLEVSVRHSARPPFDGPVPVTARAAGLLARAEAARARHADTPDLWSDAAIAWDALGRPHRVAYARWREAEAWANRRGGRRQLTTALRAATEVASGHAPLTAAVNLLAARAAIQDTRLHPPVRVAAASSGLTARELMVLHLLVGGATNSEIGRQLYIGSKTAGVHVSNIMRKLAARSRVEAVAIALRANLLEPAEPPARSVTS